MAGRSDLEEFLLTLLWGADHFINPSIWKLNETFDAWDRRNGGLSRQWRQLEDRKLVVRSTRTKTLVYRLTTEGRTVAMGGSNLITAWEQPWDGKWRMILFDLPERDKQVRLRLWRWLRANHFGFLQESVWIRPDPVSHVAELLKDFKDDVEALTIMESTCAAGYENAAIVQGAWDFVEINKRHRAYVQSHSVSPRDVNRLRASRKALNNWLRSEKVAWRHATQLDPLLPRALWPSDYQGETSWRTRVQSFAILAR